MNRSTLTKNDVICRKPMKLRAVKGWISFYSIHRLEPVVGGRRLLVVS